MSSTRDSVVAALESITSAELPLVTGATGAISTSSDEWKVDLQFVGLAPNKPFHASITGMLADEGDGALMSMELAEAFSLDNSALRLHLGKSILGSNSSLYPAGSCLGSDGRVLQTVSLVHPGNACRPEDLRAALITALRWLYLGALDFRMMYYTRHPGLPEDVKKALAARIEEATTVLPEVSQENRSIDAGRLMDIVAASRLIPGAGEPTVESNCVRVPLQGESEQLGSVFVHASPFVPGGVRFVVAPLAVPRSEQSLLWFTGASLGQPFLLPAFSPGGSGGVLGYYEWMPMGEEAEPDPDLVESVILHLARAAYAVDLSILSETMAAAAPDLPPDIIEDMRRRRLTAYKARLGETSPQADASQPTGSPA